MPTLRDVSSLEELNAGLHAWIEEYHHRTHSSTTQTPLKRYLTHLHSLRPAPDDLREYFRIPARRKVDKDRSVSLHGRCYEAPVGLIGKWVTLLYHKHDRDRIEVFLSEQSCGFLTPLDPGINSRVRRTANLDIELFPDLPPNGKSYQGGSLFEESKQ